MDFHKYVILSQFDSTIKMLPAQCSPGPHEHHLRSWACLHWIFCPPCWSHPLRRQYWWFCSGSWDCLIHSCMNFNWHDFQAQGQLATWTWDESRSWWTPSAGSVSISPSPSPLMWWSLGSEEPGDKSDDPGTHHLDKALNIILQFTKDQYSEKNHLSLRPLFSVWSDSQTLHQLHILHMGKLTGHSAEMIRKIYYPLFNALRWLLPQ